MNTAQRIVLVIALGIARVAIAATVNLVLLDPIDPGWFSYSPGIGATFSPSQTDDYFVVASDRSIVEQAAAWLIALAVWTGASVWLLRNREAT